MLEQVSAHVTTLGIVLCLTFWMLGFAANDAARLAATSAPTALIKSGGSPHNHNLAWLRSSEMNIV